MHDRDVRFEVRRWLDEIHAGDEDTRVVEEMGIWAGSVRVDVAVINGEFQGFELKSAKDNLDRLPGQAALYNQVFDRVTLVIAERHASKAQAIVPEWWGISLASAHPGPGVRLHEARVSARNPTLDPLQIARVFWRPEALAVLDRRGLSRGVRSKPVDVLSRRLAEELSVDDLRSEVRAAIKARSHWRSGKPIGH